uniref:Major facilitator superfamily (MFS) profile domain-containing protein n=1 Tax=Daucus carota subsp. sativus TaxID=79200 RepID=A0A164SIM6_DAUCS
MAITNTRDIENCASKGPQDLEEPFIEHTNKVVVISEDEETSETNVSVGMVLFSTCVAVCGSFEFGSCVSIHISNARARAHTHTRLEIKVGYSAPAQSAIREDLNLTLAQAMRMSAAFCIAGWLAVYLSMEALLLDIGRFLTGYGIGVFSFVLMIVIGASLAFLMGTMLSWRNLAITGLVPCIALLVGLFFIPESPRWLAKVGLEKEFEVALRRLRGKDADVSAEAAEIKAKGEVLCKFSIPIDCGVQIAVGLMVFQQIGGINGVGFYASETFVAAGMSSGNTGTIAYALIQVPITIVGALLMDRSGRRPLLMVSATGTFLGSFLTGTAFLLEGQTLLLDWVPTLAVSGVLIYIASFSIGMGAVPWVIMSEIFPIHIKGIAGSLVVLVNWLGAWAVSYTFNFLMSWSSTGTFFVFSGSCALTVLFVAKVVPETKGKTLEEIQSSINS